MTEAAASDAREAIRRHAGEIGFDTVGFATAAADPDDARHLATYLAEGRHGDMTWMATTADRRADPRAPARRPATTCCTRPATRSPAATRAWSRCP